jgi:hypothetical protein
MSNPLLKYVQDNSYNPAVFGSGLGHFLKVKKQDAVLFKASYLAKDIGTDLFKKEAAFKDMSDMIACVPNEMLQEEYAKNVAKILDVKMATLLRQAKTDRETKNGRSRKDIENDLKRARYVAEQVERREMDITSQDDDLRIIATSLASLGEPARDIFHRICSLRPEYLKSQLDPLFSIALKEKKSRDARRFFKTALEYDLEVRVPKTIAEAKEHKTAKDIIGDESMADEYLTYAIWEENGVYKSLDQYEQPYVVSNFLMRILFHVATSDDTAYRLIAIENIHGHKAIIHMNTDNFVSVGTFKKEVARKGNFIWKGGDVDLVRLQDKLQREEKPTIQIKTLGWYKRGKFFAFANGIYDVSEDVFIPVDEFGIVAHRYTDKAGDTKEQNYFIPAMSKVYADKDDMFANDKKFIYQESSTTFNEWSKLFTTVYDKQGMITVMYYIMAIFSDIIFKDLGNRFPLLFIYGKRGTGKGTMAQSIMKLFGLGIDQIMLGGASTAVGFMRKFAQFVNAIVWLDEYKNNLVSRIIESIKNIYDRKGYERGKKDNSFETESTPVYSACILSGQEMPTIEPALFSRGILTSLTETTFNEEQRNNKRKLDRMEEAGLSHITVYLMRHRPLIAEKFLETYDIELRKFIKDVNNNEIDERMFVNYAAMITIAEIINSVEDLPFNLVSFKTMMKQNLLEQFYVLKGSDDASKFWSVVQFLFTNGDLIENKHFILKNGYLYLRVSEIHQVYAKTLLERKDPNGLDKETLCKSLESDPKSFMKRTKKWFHLVGSQLWCHVFKYSELTVDLIKAGTEDELKQRYKDMNLRYVDHDEDPEQGKLDLKVKKEEVADQDEDDQHPGEQDEAF